MQQPTTMSTVGGNSPVIHPIKMTIRFWKFLRSNRDVIWRDRIPPIGKSLGIRLLEIWNIYRLPRFGFNLHPYKKQEIIMELYFIKFDFNTRIFLVKSDMKRYFMRLFFQKDFGNLKSRVKIHQLTNSYQKRFSSSFDKLYSVLRLRKW